MAIPLHIQINDDMSRQKGTKMDILSQAAQFNTIRAILEQNEHFEQMRIDQRHRVIYDIVDRFDKVESYWTNLDKFVENYLKWLEKYIWVEGADEWANWEQWSEMLRILYLGD